MNSMVNGFGCLGKGRDSTSTTPSTSSSSTSVSVGSKRSFNDHESSALSKASFFLTNKRKRVNVSTVALERTLTDVLNGIPGTQSAKLRLVFVHALPLPL